MEIEVLEDNNRIDSYLSLNLDMSRSLIKKMILDQDILLNNKVVKSSTSVKTGDVIKIIGNYKDKIDLEGEDIPLNIIYEDDDCILINKESGMVVHPGNGNYNHTLVNALIHYSKSLSDEDPKRPGIVHRIDKDTSGLILVAKNNKAHEILADDFKNKRIKRVYYALVVGVLPHDKIKIDLSIGRDPKNRLKMGVVKGGKKAVTHVEVLKRYKEYTLVKCVLETGRTHQIRVHLSHIGYPIYNDPLYGESYNSYGQFLISKEIDFESPITKKKLHFEIPLDREFQEFIDKLD